MPKEYIEDQHFKTENYAEHPLSPGEYENCTFTDCVFYTADLSHISFSDCVFSNCDLSMANLKNTGFSAVKFKNSKLLGLRFDECNDFSLSFDFESCTLNFSSFYKLKLKNIQFKDCKLESVEFTEADLSSAVFRDCDLMNAIFERTKLEGADFRTAFNVALDPEINQLKKARFSQHNIAGLLNKYKIIIE